MAFKIQAKLEDKGLQKLLEKLSTLPKKVQKKTLNKAIAAGNRIILGAAKARVRRRTGMLARALGQRVKIYRSGGVVVGITGPRTGYVKTRTGRKATALAKRFAAAGVKPTKYAHLVEQGHSGPHPAPAYPFLRPAFDSTRGQVLDAMSRIIQDGILEAAK